MTKVQNVKLSFGQWCVANFNPITLADIGIDGKFQHYSMDCAADAKCGWGTDSYGVRVYSNSLYITYKGHYGMYSRGEHSFSMTDIDSLLAGTFGAHYGYDSNREEKFIERFKQFTSRIEDTMDAIKHIHDMCNVQASLLNMEKQSKQKKIMDSLKSLDNVVAVTF